MTILLTFENFYQLLRVEDGVKMEEVEMEEVGIEAAEGALVL